MSSAFTREKRDGSYRMILNLKQLNKRIEYEHFKMDSLQSVLNIIRPNCWMSSVDLKDAFYTVPIHPDHQKFLTFKLQGHCYTFSGMPNGYESVHKTSQTTILYFENSWLSMTTPIFRDIPFQHVKIMSMLQLTCCSFFVLQFTQKNQSWSLHRKLNS